MGTFEGALTALITPFRDDRLDEKALRALVAEQIDGGIDGLVPSGTTGESASLSHDEYARLLEIVVQEARGRVPVIAGVGSPSTGHALELAKLAEREKEAAERDARKAEQVALEAERAGRATRQQTATAAEQKAARDARYAARKARKK